MLFRSIVVGSTILLALLFGTAFLLQRRKKAREVAEIPIRRSKIGSRLGLRIFGSHYDERIGRSNGGEKFTQRSVSSRESVQREPEKVGRTPVSPSLYSPRRLTRATRLSTMTFGSVTGWLDKSTIGRPQPAFMGTPSQLLDAPRPLFAGRVDADDSAPWSRGRSRGVSPPRPARGAEPLGRLSGMGFGLGMR